MPENKNSFIKSKMNKDLDERLLPSNEYRDASNIAISRSEGSDVGALESILGNISVFTGSATAKIIGYFVDESNGFIYYFSTDFNGNLNERPTSTDSMSINRFDTNTNSNINLVSGYFLNFSKKNSIYGINLIEDLLFWTDNRNQPRKINVDTAAGNSNYYITEDQISVCKFSPYIPVDFINLRSPLTTQPTTMTRQLDESSSTIGGVKWSNNNLDVTSYANGEPIPEVQDATTWAALTTGAWCYYDNNSGYNGIYGKLYNKFAVEDERGLAPLGYRIPKQADWTALATALGGASVAGEKMKNKKSWNTVNGDNSSGFYAIPSGKRTKAGPGTFAGGPGTGTDAYYWNSDGDDGQQLTGVSGATEDNLITNSSVDDEEGRSVRIIQDSSYQWAGDPEFLTDRFAKFSYRFKFDDNEYSVIAPFSQDCFIPERNGEFGSGTDYTDAAFRTTVVEFMQNNVNNAVLNITLPSKDIITDYKIKEIDIIFKESDGLAYQVLETIDVDTTFISNLNNTNIFQYNYQSTIPFKTLQQAEAGRVYDKVPVRALAQESSGNRVIYGNFIQSYTAPLGLSYFADVDEKSLQIYTEYRNHSVKQNRNYQVGLILADKYGRETDVILSNYDNLLNAQGNPQRGSNVFSSYKPSSFTPDVEDWMGDNLELEFNNIIPEGENANGLSGFPGSYAQGNYYLTTASETGAYFNNNSTQELTSTLGQTEFDFDDLLYDDANSGSNTLNVYVNAGSGWILNTEGASADYEISEILTDKLRVTFASGLSADDGVKAEILFGKTDYKYTVNNMFANFAADYTSIFGPVGTVDGKYLRGLYSDYVQIAEVTTVSGTETTLRTKKEIATSYIFPVTTATPSTNATYDINPNGFYTYRVAVKQQQQEYYNVYLPGIVDGYPLEADTKEQGETAFITLTSDNINKVPRDLQEVGPLDDQFNSDARMWGRVTNTSDGKMEQYIPTINSDKVDLIGTVADVFPGVDTGTDAGEINQYALFDFVSKPNIGKIATEGAIGITEDEYVAPVGSNPYPANTNLAVYETTPVMSALELFYETSTAGLVSDINYNVKNNTTEITGSTIEAAGGGFDEADVAGTTITNEFYSTDIYGSRIVNGLVGGTDVLTSSITTNTTAATNGGPTTRAFTTSGSGTGATIQLTVALGVVTVISVIERGTGYAAGDTLTFASGVIGGSTNLVVTLVAADLMLDTTAILLSVCSKYKNGLLNQNNRASEFKLESGSATGSYKISTATVPSTTFYAGENNATANFFEFTIQFTQSDGVTVNQSYNTTLTNIAPVVSLNTTPLSPDAGTDIEIFNSITPVLGTTYGPTGTNGSANTSEYYLFPSQTGAGWSITELKITPSGEAEETIALTSIGDYFTITRQGKIDAGTGYGFQVKSVSTYTLVAGTVFKFKFTLKDAGGLGTETGQITLPAV